ncbi:MAG: hypothetical protein ACRDKD_04105 [Solirubrobacteraceae bacterium]
MDEWVLGEAIRLLGTREGPGKPVALAVNVSAATMNRPEIGDLVVSDLAAAGIRPQLIVEAVAEIVYGFDAQVMAEFVGSQETVGLLKGFGVAYGQGYFLGHPEPLPDRVAPRARMSTLRAGG